MSKGKPVATMQYCWVDWYPQAGWDLDFWLAVAKTVRKRGIRKGDKYAVLRVCREVMGKHRRNRKYTRKS